MKETSWCKYGQKLVFNADNDKTCKTSSTEVKSTMTVWVISQGVSSKGV